MKIIVKKTLYFISMAVFILCVFNNTAIAASSEILHDNYFVTRAFGIKTGYLSELQRKKTENGKKYIVTDRHFEQKIKRLNNVIQIIQDTSYVEEETGKPVSFSMASTSAGEKTNIYGKFNSDDEMSVESDVNGVKTQKTVKFKDKILFPYAIDSLYKYPNNKNISYSTIEPSIDVRAIKVKTEKQGQENLSADGLNRYYDKYKVSVNIMPGITSYEWRSRDGQTVKEATSIFKIEQILSNKNEATNFSGDYDMFSGGLIYLDKAIADPDSIDQISYKITVTGIPSENIFLQDERQKTNRLSDNVIYLTVKSVKPEPDNYPYPFDTKGFEEYLKSGAFIMPDSDKISAIAKSISAGEIDAYVIANKMESWVFNNLTNKNYSLNFANAVETLETKSGDCTEHSILLASLLRAAGIPSKTVVGLIYTDMPKPAAWLPAINGVSVEGSPPPPSSLCRQSAFGYHMWVKAYVGTKWVNLDATLPYKNFVPTHIAMAETPLNNISDRADLLINVLKSFSSLKIEVLSANKPVISSLDNGILKINLGSSSDGDVIAINTIKKSTSALQNDNTGIKNISLSGFDEKDYVRSAFYNFLKGDIQKSLDDFNTFYGSISDADDFLYMKLGLKLSSLGFFNLASKSFDSVKNKDVWKLQIDNTKNIYFPNKIDKSSDEMIICDALSKIEFQNQPEAGVFLINKYKNKFQNSDYAHYILAKAYISEKKPDLAQEEFRKALRINPENLNCRMEQAKVYIQRNSYKSAEKELNLVKEIADRKQITDEAFRQDFNEQSYWLQFKQERKNPVKSKYFKARYYETKNEYNVALEILKGILPGNDDKIYIFETMGNIYLKQNQYDKAKQSFNKVLALDGKNVSALSGLGEIYLSEGNNKQALEKYLKALEIEPNNSKLKLKTAEIYEILGQEEEAYKYLKDVLQDASIALKAGYNIGMMYLRAGDEDEAEKFLKKALSVDPMHSLIWVDLAGIEISKGNYSEAENYLKPVSYMDDKSSYYYYYLGLINKARGDIEQAKENFGKALELNPDFEEANKAAKRL